MRTISFSNSHDILLIEQSLSRLCKVGFEAFINASKTESFSLMMVTHFFATSPPNMVKQLSDMSAISVMAFSPRPRITTISRLRG